MKKFFAAMVLAGLVAVPVTFAQDPPKTDPAPKKEKSKKKPGKKKAATEDTKAPEAK